MLPSSIDNGSHAWGPTSQWVAWYMAQFNQEIDLYEDGDGGPFDGADNNFRLARQFINGDINNVNCNTTFRDPTQYVLNSLRQVAFRTAVTAGAANIAEPNVLFGNSTLAQESAALTRNWTQDVNVSGRRSIVAFSVSIPYLACAVVCSLLAVLAIVPLYWTARSERIAPPSFNPLDVARMFDAPLLRDAREEDIEDYVRKHDGLRRVRYGVRESDDSEEKVIMRVVSEDI